jgi:hypothetical protein
LEQNKDLFPNIEHDCEGGQCEVHPAQAAVARDKEVVGVGVGHRGAPSGHAREEGDGAGGSMFITMAASNGGDEIVKGVNRARKRSLPLLLEQFVEQVEGVLWAEAPRLHAPPDGSFQRGAAGWLHSFWDDGVTRWR